MIEKIATQASELMEATGPLAEDKLLERLHRCTKPNANCSHQDKEALHKDLERCEVFEMYNAYVGSRVPTLAHIDKNIQRVVENVPESLKNDPEAISLANYLRGRHASISHDIRAYVGLVIRFVTLEHSTLRFRDYDKYIEQMRKIDADRRRMHDNLLTSLDMLRIKMEEAYDFGLCEKDDFYIWSPGDAQEIPPQVVPVFSRAAIANRDLIKNWALATDFAEHFERLSQLLENKN